MKLAIVLRGISYYDNKEVNVCNSPTVDYRDCLDVMESNLLAPLKEKFDQIDFFIVTYNNSKMKDIFETFSPVDAMIYPFSSILENRHRITVKLLIDSLKVLEPYQQNYDHVLITRFDLYYYVPLNLSKIDWNKFNFGWKGEHGQCDDSFWLFKPEHIPRLKTYLLQENFNASSCHDFNYRIGLDNCNYISKPLDPVNGYHMPDFWFFARYLPEFKAGTYKLYDWPPKKTRNRIAIIFRGIMFYNGQERVCYSDRPVDYKECLESFKTNIYAPLLEVFNEIDFYIVTYDNDRTADILKDFKPKDMMIYPRSSIMTYRNVITVKLMTDAISLIEPYQDKYDNILITRSDLYYYNKPLDVKNIPWNKFNFGWQNVTGHCDDSFWIIDPKFIPNIKSYLEKMRNVGSNNCHTMNTELRSEDVNYISRPLTYDSNTHKGFGMPDFWFFSRYLDVYDKENRVLKSQRDGDLHLYD